MKNTKRMLAMVFVLVFMFTVVISSAVFAGTDNGKGNGKDTTTETDKVKVNDKTKVEGTETVEATVETEEDKAVKEKDKVMEHKKDLMKQLIEARTAGNVEEATKLMAQVKEYKEELKKMVRERYTAEEMVQLQLSAQTIENTDPTVEVLPVDSIIAKGKNLKLDMPPVIKDGKVLIPIRAFSQAYGAEVKWDPILHTITIVKEGMEIVLKTDSSIAVVNGVETKLEVPVKGINGRTVMSVGFLAEQFGLKTEVDPEDGTIEIEEGTPVPTVTPTPTPLPAGTTGN